MATVYAGGSVNYFGEPYVSLRSYDSGSGSAGWTADHGGIIYAVAADANGNVIIGGFRDEYTSYKTTRKYDSTGSELWNADHGITVFGVAADGSGNVFTAGQVSSSVTTRKYNSAGSQQWTANHGTTVYGIAADASGNSYTGGARTSSVTTRKYNSAGSQQWTADHGATVYGIGVDTSGNVYTCGERTSNLTIRKYDSAGSLQWSADSGDDAVALCVDSVNGVLYVCGPPSGSYYVRKFSTSDGAEITTGWPLTSGFSLPKCLAVDSSGNVYFGGAVSSSKTTYKYNSAKSLQWSVNHGVNYVFGIAIYEPSEIPGLPMEIALGIPTSGFVTLTPGLEVSLALGTPASIVPAPPDPSTILVPAQTIYRLYFTGGDWMELPMRSFQCQRRLGASTWVTVIVDYSTASRAALDARIAVGGRLSIFSGVRYADGTEVMGEFLQAALTRIDDERDAYHGMMTITGRVIPVAFSATSRTLQGVQSRGVDSEGRRVCICAVDPLLRPNDTVNDGVQTWTAGTIDYTVSPANATMHVQAV